MYETKPRSLLNVLRFSAKVETIINEKTAPAASAAAADPDAPTTSAAILLDAEDRKVVDRVTALYDALLHDERAVEVAPLVVQRADGTEITAEEAAALDVELFAEGISAFFASSPKLTRGLLGLPSGTARANSSPSPTSPNS